MTNEITFKVADVVPDVFGRVMALTGGWATDETRQRLVMNSGHLAELAAAVGTAPCPACAGRGPAKCSPTMIGAPG